MFNIILSICKSLYWVKHWNVRRSTSFHENLLQTFNSPVNQLLLCPEWLWCFYKNHSSVMLENSHVSHAILAVFFLCGIVIRVLGFSCCIFLVLLIIDFISSASFVPLALSSPWSGKRGLIYMLLSISERVHLYAPTFVFAHLALCQR